MDITCHKHKITPFWDCKDPECDPYSEENQKKRAAEAKEMSDAIDAEVRAVENQMQISVTCGMCFGKKIIPGPSEFPHLTQPCPHCSR